MSDKKIICITGDIGSGKTTLLEHLAKQGYFTFNMDNYIHDIYVKGQIGYQAILKNFGKQFVNNEAVDRNKLKEIINQDNRNLQKLNKIMFPIIQQKIRELDKRNEQCFIELGICFFYPQVFLKFFNKIAVINARKTLILENKNKKNAIIIKKPTMFVGFINLLRENKRKIKFCVLENNKNLPFFLSESTKKIKNFF